MNSENRRDPERLLAEITREERRSRMGRLKIFLGYASGVGKSARMFDEGRRRLIRGEDVIVGAIQSRYSPEIAALLSTFEEIPTSTVEGKQVLNLEGILARRPQVVLIDGLAYDNPPGIRFRYRWQEIEELLKAGISVIASINLQFIDDLQDELESLTGKRSTQTVPLAFLKRADDIEIVDTPAKDQQLSRLRGMALVVAAEVVEAELRSYLAAHDIVEHWGLQERILVGITPRSDARAVLESGKRNADRFHGELLAAYVGQSELSPEDRAALDRNLAIAREMNATVHLLHGRDPVKVILDCARSHGVTQIFIGHSQRRGWWHRFRGNPVERLIDLADGIDVRVFPQRSSS